MTSYLIEFCSAAISGEEIPRFRDPVVADRILEPQVFVVFAVFCRLRDRPIGGIELVMATLDGREVKYWFHARC